MFKMTVEEVQEIFNLLELVKRNAKCGCLDRNKHVRNVYYGHTVLKVQEVMDRINASYKGGA